METVKTKALKSFTEFVSGYGMVHGDPEGCAEAKNPMVPVSVAVKLADAGSVALPKSWAPPAAETADDAAEANADAATAGADGAP